MTFRERLKNDKMIIGMVHLKSLPGSFGYCLDLDEIFELAYQDLKALQEGGADAAIVENYFDSPYHEELSRLTLISFVSIFTRLKQKASIPLGVNIQYTNGEEEMEVAHICKADFIRSETFVETRYGAFGTLKPQAAVLHACRSQLQSDVCVLADINVKYTFPIVDQPFDYSIHEAINSGADAIILTGLESGVSPSLEDVERYQLIAKNFPIILGSGIKKSNIKSFLTHANGAIIGTSVKCNGDITMPVMTALVKELVLAK